MLLREYLEHEGVKDSQYMRTKDAGVGDAKKEMSEQSKKIEERYRYLKSKSKEDIVKIVQSSSRLDMSHVKSEPKDLLINHIINGEFRRKDLDAWGNES